MERIDKLKELLAANPEDSFVQHALALEYIKVNREEEAKALFLDLLGRDRNYVGSYYHLAKLLERQGHHHDALQWYEKGMEAARAANDGHAYNELQTAYEDLTDL
ncbi:MAG TPA: tetratricopeptide repeat protein [Flavisolibacter sp.]|jgi:Tfp pilus assembly protein PilF|nr:tetratricopeptide repeat protein [Flavisolibacter sp.]